MGLPGTAIKTRMQVEAPVEDHVPTADAKQALVLFEVDDCLGQDA